MSTNKRYVVGRTDEIAAGTRKLIAIPGVGEVGVFNNNGEFFAVKNVCPHQGGPMCRGLITGTTRPRFEPGKRPEMEWIRDGEILRCPWHGWEFDIRTGKAIFSSRTRVSVYDVFVDEVEPDVPSDAETYPVSIERRDVVLEIPDRSDVSRRSVDNGGG